MAHRIGVCSWSLMPSNTADLVERVRACEIDAIQLALDPVRTGDMNAAELARALDAAGITVLSGMMAMKDEDYSTLDSIRRTGGVVPDSTWPANKDAATRNADIAHDLGLDLVTFHAGFIPHDPADPDGARVLDRLRHLADIFGDRGIRVGLETGQETGETLMQALDRLAHPNVGVNFDPANMILYGMGDPVDSLRLLAPRVTQIHIKDATPSATPAQWGAEVPAGQGAVDWARFFGVIRETGITADLVIEREAGDDRARDIVRAHQLIESHLGAHA